MGGKRITARDRKKVLDVYLEDPRLSSRKIAGLTGMRPSAVLRIIALYKAGRLDRDGFEYERPLCL